MDNQDLQIVKFKGRAVISKEARERYPKMALADDVLEFPRYDFPIRVKITHFDYQRVKGNK